MQFTSLLKEYDNQLKIIGIHKMLECIDTQWSEISEHISLIEALSEDIQFPERPLAAFLCAKIYYHLENFDEALNYALQSNLFKPEEDNQFNQSLIRHCIDEYIKSPQQISAQRIQLVEKIIEISCQQGNYISAIGVSIDIKRRDIVQKILGEWKHPSKMIQVLQLINTVQRGAFRDDLLRMSVDLIYQEAKEGQIPNEEWGHFVKVLVQLGEAIRVGEILWSLVSDETFILQSGSRLSLAYQLCIDMADNQKPQFNNQVINALPIDPNFTDEREKLVKLLSGEHQRKVQLYFLKNYKSTDPLTLSQIKGTTDPKFSVHHGAALMGHAIAQAGTQDTNFLKDNAQWATKCQYWQRFTATSTLGMIHKYNIEESQQLMATHLKPDNSPFEIGGAYFGLGLINFGKNDKLLIQKCVDQVQSQKEPIVHGALWGSGLIAFAQEDENLHQLYKGIIQKNESVYGEGASIAMGLLHAGSASVERSMELLQLANQSDKEKISRTLGLAIACVNFQCEDRASQVIDAMLKDNDFNIRYGGCFALGMAYVGSGSNKVIERLLQVSVEDVSDDVRRAAVIAFGFVMAKNYEAVPKIMRLLILSYNPHIRYGTAIAMGIACAGTMYQEAITMLEPMLQDGVDFVRQGALIALSMILSQCNKDCEQKFEQIQKTIQEIAAKKHETVLTKLGVCVAQGLLEAGGRNVVVSLTSYQGAMKLDACVGMLWFLNYWFWFPCLSMLTLSFSCSAFIGLDDNLDIPRDFQIQCNTRVYEYPPFQKANEKKVAEKKTAQLSTTNKVRARTNRKEQNLKDGVPLSHQESKLSLEHQQESKLSVNKEMIIEEKVEEVKKKDEPSILCNPFRVLEKQKKVLQLLEGSRFTPLLKDRKQGLVLLIDQSPNQQCDVIFMNQRVQAQAQAQASQQDAPEEFVFDEAKQDE